VPPRSLPHRRQRAGGRPSRRGAAPFASPRRRLFPPLSLTGRLRGLRACPASGSAGRVNPEECSGRNAHADEMDANLMLMSRGRPGLSRAPQRPDGSWAPPATPTRAGRQPRHGGLRPGRRGGLLRRASANGPLRAAPAPAAGPFPVPPARVGAFPASRLSFCPYGAATPAARPCLGKRGMGSSPYPMAGRRRGITTAKSSTSTTTPSGPVGSTPGTGG